MVTSDKFKYKPGPYSKCMESLKRTILKKIYKDFWNHSKAVLIKKDNIQFLNNNLKKEKTLENGELLLSKIQNLMQRYLFFL